MLIDEILKATEEDLHKRIVKDVRIGLGYTAIKLDDDSCGLAATLRDEVAGCCSLLNKAGELIGRKAYQLSRLAASTDVLKSAVGLATINASINKDVESNTNPPLKALKISKANTVGMVGYFEPLIDPIQKKSKQLYVLERKPSEEEFVYPDWGANILLPKCDVAIISGTALINKTMDHLLSLCNSRAKIAILGPSTTLSPIFKKYGVDFLFGAKVGNQKKVLQIVSEGGGTRIFGKNVYKINRKL